MQTPQRPGAAASGSGTALAQRKTDLQALSSSFSPLISLGVTVIAGSPAKGLETIVIHKNNQFTKWMNFDNLI
jgi:hypothetical protein